MAMKQVDLGGERKRFKAVELPRFQTVVPEPLAEKAKEQFAKFEDRAALGVQKRIDVTKGIRRKQAGQMLDWFYGEGLSMAQQMIAPGSSSIQLQGTPVVFFKTNLNQGLHWRMGDGILIQDEGVKSQIGKLPRSLMRPDNFMQWSPDINHPFSLAHIDAGELILKALEIANERGWFYPLFANNGLWHARKNNPRLGGYIGATGTVIPGEQSMDKHKYYYEGKHTCRYIFTPKEEKFFKERGWDDRQISAADKIGFDVDKYFEELVEGKHDDELLKPGVKADFTAAIPYQRTLRRSMGFWRKTKHMDEPGWWKETNRMDDEGVTIGFGEFEEEEFRERIKKLGYTEVDEEALFRGKVPESLSNEYSIPKELAG